MAEDINFKELDVVDPDGPPSAPESDYEVAADYPAEAEPEGEPVNG